MAEFRVSNLMGDDEGGDSNKPNPTPPSSSQPLEPAKSEAIPVSAQRTYTPREREFEPRPNDSSGDEISLRQYWDIIFRYRVYVLLVVFFGLGAGIVLAFILPIKYSATTKILKEREGQSPLSRFTGSSGDEGGLSIDTIMQMAHSQSVLTRAVKIIDNESNPSEGNPEDRLSEADVGGASQVYLSSDSEDIMLIRATVTSDPKNSAKISNALGQALIDEVKDVMARETVQKIELLDKNIEDSKTELDELNKSLHELHKKNADREYSSINLKGDEDKILGMIDNYQMKLQEGTLRKRELSDQIRTIKEKFGIATIPLDKIVWDNMGNALNQKLQRLKIERQELLARYKPKNPSIKKVNVQIASMEKILRPEVKGDEEEMHHVQVDEFHLPLVTKLLTYHSESEVLENKIEDYRVIIQDLNRQLVEVPEEVKEMKEINNQKKLVNETILNMKRLLQETRLNLASMSVGMEISEWATAPRESAAPVTKLGMAGFLAGGVLGLVLAFLLNNWDNTIRSANELKHQTGYPTLGALPRWDDEDELLIHTQNKKLVEFYGVLANNIRFGDYDAPEKCLMVTSSVQGEGKSLTSVNLSSYFAMEGDITILISADLRNTKNFRELLPKDHPLDAPGLTEYLNEDVEIHQVVYPTVYENLFVVPSGRAAHNPNRLLKSDRLGEILAYAQKNFEIVIVDAPPVLPVVDATILSPYVRGVLIVVRWARTPIPAVQESISRMEHVGSPVVGLALNGIRDLKSSYGSYYHFKGDKDVSA